MEITGLSVILVVLLTVAGALLLGIMYLFASPAVKIERRKYG